MAKVAAILTADVVREAIRRDMSGGEPFTRSDFLVTFERDGKRYECKMRDCDRAEAVAFQEAFMLYLREQEQPPEAAAAREALLQYLREERSRYATTTKVAAIITREQLREMSHIPRGDDNHIFERLMRSDGVVTFERDRKRYQRRLCDCDGDEIVAVGAAILQIRDDMRPGEAC